MKKKFNSYLSKYQKKLAPPPRSIWTNPIHFIACGFGIGVLPFPGTLATIAAIPLILIFSRTTHGFYLLACLILFVIGIYICGKTNRDFKTDDHPAACFDEIATFPLALFGIEPTWYFLLIGFVLFRFFDIIKPFPIRWVDKNIHGGFGVMFDDLLAAIATLIVLHGIVVLI